MLRRTLPLVLASLLVGCPEKTPVPVEPPPPPKPRSERPPFPTMATPAWGERVIEQLGTEADPSLSGKGYQPALDAALDALRSDDEGSAARLVRASAAAWRAAMSDRDRATAAALAGVGLTLDPTVEGFKDRLTDAYGLAGYSGTLDGTVLAQSARAQIAVAAGRVSDGEKLVDVLTRGDVIDGESAFLLALARVLAGRRTDEVVNLLEKVLKDRADNTRARVTLARVYLDLFAVPEVLRVSEGQSAPMLKAIRGRALVLAGKRADGVALLREVAGNIDERRKGEVLYWLGRSLSDNQPDEARSILGQLSGRPGFEREADLLTALLAQHAGDYRRAREFAQKVKDARGAPLSVSLDARWAVVNACAGLGDLACVAKDGVAVVEIDGDAPLLAHARAAAGVVGGNESVDTKAAFSEAHRLAPFDPGLAKHTGLAAVPGGAELKTAVRAARRSLALGAPGLAGRLVEGPVAEQAACRVCRALHARAARAPGETARRAVRALDGEGPALADSDLIDVIALLGKAAEPAAAKHLDRLMKDPREEVRRAAAQAKKAAVSIPRPDDGHGHK
jgi:hypothetical protein